MSSFRLRAALTGALMLAPSLVVPSASAAASPGDDPAPRCDLTVGTVGGSAEVTLVPGARIRAEHRPGPIGWASSTGEGVVATGPLSEVWRGRPGVESSRSIQAVTGAGRLVAYDVSSADGPFTFGSGRVLARGLKNVRHFATAGVGHTTYYTVDRAGVLSRFRSGRDGSYVALRGTARGFGGLRAMTELESTSTRHVFLATRTDGALVTITVPVSPTLRPRVDVLRAKTWNMLDQLVVRRYTPGEALVLGRNSRSGEAHLYSMGAGRRPGTATSVRRWGRVSEQVRRVGPRPVLIDRVGPQ